jgi:hypothetical protein
VEFEPNEDFERELRQAFERRPAPPGLKRKLMQRRSVRAPRHLSMIWQRLAASIALIAALAGGLAGGLEWRNREEQRKDEAARQQVLKALRITAHALNQMNAQLAAHSRAAEE